MADINSLTLTGRLTKDATVKSFNNPNTGKTSTKAEFSIAVGKSKKNPDGTWGEETSYFDCDYWTSPSLAPYLTKGRQVCIDAELVQEKWTDAQSGQPRSKVVIHVNDLKLLAEPKAQQGNGQPQGGYAPQNNGGYGAQPNVNYNAQPQNNGGYNARPQAQPNVNYNAQPQGNGGYGARPQAQGTPNYGAPQGGFEEGNIPF